MRQFMGCDVLVCDTSPLRTLQAAINHVRRNPQERQLCIHSRAYSEMVRNAMVDTGERPRYKPTERPAPRCKGDSGAGFVTGMMVGGMLQ